MGAASTSGYASRPLPLFYALSQAGRAIAAAWADDPWVPTSGHGLKHELGESALRTTVWPTPATKEGRIDTFSCVAAAAGQGTLTKGERVELGALWASLPDLWEQDLREERWRRPLPVRRVEHDVSEVHLLDRWVDATIFLQYQRHLDRPVRPFGRGRRRRVRRTRHGGTRSLPDCRWLAVQPAARSAARPQDIRHVGGRSRLGGSGSDDRGPRVGVPQSRLRASHQRSAVAAAGPQRRGRLPAPADDLVGAALRAVHARPLSPGRVDGGAASR